jgi:hypothetical protein
MQHLSRLPPPSSNLPTNRFTSAWQLHRTRATFTSLVAGITIGLGAGAIGAIGGLSDNAVTTKHADGSFSVSVDSDGDATDDVSGDAGDAYKREGGKSHGAEMMYRDR